MKHVPLGLLYLFLGILLNRTPALADITFVPGNYYTAYGFNQFNGRIITEYDPSGNIVGSLSLPFADGYFVQGLTFGPDGLLYADLTRFTQGYSILALDSSGNVHQSYSGSTYVEGNLNYGKITTDGQYLYITGQNQLTRFLLGDPNSGTVIYQGGSDMFDTKVLPNGHLLVVGSNYGTTYVNEITKNGTFVRSVTLGSINPFFADFRSVEYNPATDELFLGNSGSQQIMRFNLTTGALEKSVSYTYPDDLFLTASGQLLTGSGYEKSKFFDQELNPMGQLGTMQQLIVTQLIPEPQSVFLFAIGVAVLGIFFIRSWLTKRA